MARSAYGGLCVFGNVAAFQKGSQRGGVSTAAGLVQGGPAQSLAVHRHIWRPEISAVSVEEYLDDVRVVLLTSEQQRGQPVLHRDGNTE